MFKRYVTAAVAVCIMLVAAAFAASDAQAYAFAAAKSGNGEHYEWCTAGSLDAAEDCANTKCEDQSDGDCRIVTRCENGRWSGIAEVKFKGDIRRHGSACGFTTQAKIKTKMVSECTRVKKSIKPTGTNCAATIVNPNANDTPNKYKWIWKNGSLVAQ